MWGQSMMHWQGHGAGFWWGLASALFWIVIIALVIVAIVVLLKRTQLVHSIKESDGEQAIEILNARYAKGEISTERFEQMRRTLEQRDDPSR